MSIEHPTRPNDWRKYLEPGEELLWYGRPDEALAVTRRSLSSAVAGIGPIVFAVVMYQVTGQDLAFSDPGSWPMYAIMAGLLALGLWLLVGSHFRDRRLRRHSHYTLTNRRAFIATDDGIRRLNGYPITADTRIIYKPGDLASIFFAEHRILARKHDEHDRHVPIGFERIAEGEKVYALMQSIQRGEL